MAPPYSCRSALAACGLLLVLASVPCALTRLAGRFPATALGEKNTLQWLPMREWGFDAVVVSEASCGLGPARIVPLYSYWKLGAYEVRRFCPVAQPCQDATGQAQDRKTSMLVASKTQLERIGVTVVTESDGVSYGLVASFPDEKYGLAAQYLHKAHIEGFGSCDLGQCGLYVPVKDFVQAVDLLQRMKSQLQMGHHRHVWIRHK